MAVTNSKLNEIKDGMRVSTIKAIIAVKHSAFHPLAGRCFLHNSESAALKQIITKPHETSASVSKHQLISANKPAKNGAITG